MNNRFLSEFLGGLPPTVKAVVPPERLASMASNPQALVDVEVQAQLRSLFESFGAQGTVLFEQILATLREALNTALVEVFLIGLFVVIAAWVINLFVKEIPLRKYVQAEHGGNQKSQELTRMD